MRGVVLLFAVIAAFLVTSAAGLVATEEPASAAFPGQNGRMVFSSNMRVGEGVDNPEGDYEIFTVDPDGTDLNQLTRNATHDSGTAWSADGKRIAYSAYDGNDYEIYTIPAGGGEPTQITDNTEDDSSPAFSPDGTKIAYNGLAPINEENPDWKVRSIYTIPSSGGTPTAVIRSNADSSYYGPYDPDWAPDGTKIAYWSNIEGGEGYSRLKVLNLATGHSTGVTQNSPVFSEWAPEWSPDGSQIAFVGYNRDPEGQDIYTVAAAGGTPVALTDSPDDWEGGAVWSPDGSKIAYPTSARYGSCYSSSVIHTIAAGGGTPVKATELLGSVGSLDWGTAAQDTDPPGDPEPTPDTTPPTVLCTVPAEGSDYANRFIPSATISVDFSEEMEGATINASTLYLTKEGLEESLEAAVGCEGDPCHTATLDPASDLEPDTTYTATVKGGNSGVKDPAGNALVADKTWSFTTEDRTLPTVSITTPSEDATVSGSNVTISAEASDNRSVRGVSFYVDDRFIGRDFAPGGQSGNEYSVLWDSTRMPDGQKTIKVDADDTAFNRASATTTVTVDNVPDPPPDTTPPETTIDSGSSGPTNDSSATFGFSSSEEGSSFECKIDAADYESCESGETYSGLSDGEHVFSVKAKDAVGNVDLTPASRQWTVDTTTPAVTKVRPEHRKEGVRRSIVVSAVFSKPIEASTLSGVTVGLVEAKSGKRVKATVSCNDPCTRVEIDPKRRLAANTRYRAIVGTGAKDSAGNGLDQEPEVVGLQPKVWRFRTGD
jgi:hypothetical protein